jgi:hypothetical protein
MVTVSRPFQGDTPMSAAIKRLSEAPIPQRRFTPTLSPVWESVILRCLERNPAERFANADEVSRALAGEDSTLSSAIHARKAAAGRDRAVSTGLGGRIRGIGVSVLLVVLLIAGALYYHSRQNNRLTDKDMIVLADFSNSTGDPIFDDTLKTAFSISLRQSPFLNVLSTAKSRKPCNR